MITGLGTCHRPTGRLLALLVLAVLAGLFGMHALAPGGGLDRPHTGSHGTAAAHGERVAHRAAETADAAAHQGHGQGSGHLSHADDTCAAAQAASPYTPPPLAGTPAAPSAAAPARPLGVPASALPVRAPPDLAELQLLRI
ncbi:DUF6153 family protein [Streptomyces fragilis]|uniref:DUF6153 family protein n=1 Tax=Streptomyces fragilis TaxID=67301 RepID=A0ABV2YQE5_9ACTN|nr:DUF6153 family protein [Streptomyces fragilis]